MDAEFVGIIKDVKAFYKSIRDLNEKHAVGHLIKELIQLSTNDVQKIQRNELARALLLKLKSNQSPYLLRRDLQNCKMSHADAKQRNSRSRASFLEEPREVNEHSVQVKNKRPRRTHFCSKRFTPNKYVVRVFRGNQRRRQNYKCQPVRSSCGERILADSRDKHAAKNCYSSTVSTTESEMSVLSDHSSARHRTFRGFSGEDTDLLPTSRASLASIFDKNNRSDETVERNQCNSNSKSSVLPKPAISRAQISETNFYDHLLEIRRESEIEIAKLMSRKNAELAAVRRDAERKHGELKTAIDKLEEQLAVAVSNADSVRRQSEDQCNQFQMVMTKQLDNLFEQSAQQREDIIREHQEKVEELKEAHKKDLDLLKAEQKRTEELKCCIQREKLRSSELENELKDRKSQLEKAYEHQTNLQSAVDVLTEALKNEKVNFQAQIDSQNANIEAKHAQEIAELKSNWDSEMEELTKEHDRTIRDLNETVRRLQDEVRKAKEDAENKSDKLLLKNLSVAYDQGRENAIKECIVRINMLQQRLGDAHERYELGKDNFRLRITQAREELARVQREMDKKDAKLKVNENCLNRMIQQLEEKLSVPLTCAETQTEEVQCACMALRVSEVVAKEMTFWQKKSLDQTIENVRKEESVRQEALFREKEEHIYRQHRHELEALRAEYLSQIGEWRSKVELMEKQHSQLEMELGKAKGLLAKEIETRRQQMSEISQAREFERREWKRQHDENLKCIAREQQQQIKQMRAQYMDDVENTTNQKLHQIEAEYKNQVTELSQNLQESRAQIGKLKDTLRNALHDQEKMKHDMESEYQLHLDEMRRNHEQAILSIRDNASKDRARARNAEALLRQQEKLWSTQVKQKAKHPNEDFLPADIQDHLESTIVSLRLQVDLLQKRIALLESDQMTINSVYGQSSTNKSDMQRQEEFIAEHEFSTTMDVVHPTGDKPTQTEHMPRNPNNQNSRPVNLAQAFVEKTSPDHQKPESSLSETIRRTLARMADGKTEVC